MWLPLPLQALAVRVFPDPGRRAVAAKAVSFALVGVINASVDFVVFSLLYYFLGLPIIVANLISWLVAVTGSYVMNSMTTFAAESGRQLRFKDYGSFLLAQIAGLVANTATIIIVSYSVARPLRVRGTRRNAADRRPHHRPGSGRQGVRHRGELSGQFHPLALRGVPAPRAVDDPLILMN